MWKLAYRNLRRRPLRSLVTALAVALGVALALAGSIVGAALEAASAELREGQLAGADIEITSVSAGTLPAALAEQLRAEEGLAAAAPVIRRREGRFDTSGPPDPMLGYPFRGQGLMLLGVDPASPLVRYELIDGAFLSAPAADEVVLPRSWAEPRGLTVGAQMTLETDQQRADYTVVGLADLGEVAGLPTALLPLQTLQRRFALEGVANAILVRLDNPAQLQAFQTRLERTLGPGYLVSSAASGTGKTSPILMMMSLALPFSTLAVLLAGSFLIFNAMAITIAERQRELAQLRALGMTRRQVRRLVLAEGLLIALGGVALGLALGAALGIGIAGIFSQISSGSSDVKLVVPLSGVLAASALGIGVMLATTFWLARRAGAVSPLAALRELSAEASGPRGLLRWSWVAALVALALYGLATWVAQGAVADGNLGPGLAAPFLAGLALLFLLPQVLRLTLWAGRLLLRRSAVGQLAVDSVSRRQSRAVSTGAALTLGLMLVIALNGQLLTMSGFITDASITLMSADAMLLRPMPGGASFAEVVAQPTFPPIPPGLQHDLDALGARAEVLYLANIHLPGLTMSPDVDNGVALSLGIVRNHPSFNVVEGSWAEADRIFAAGPALSLPEPAARRLGLHPGDTVDVPTLQGPQPFTVAIVGGPFPMLPIEHGITYLGAHPQFILFNAREPAAKDALLTEIEALGMRHALVYTGDPYGTIASVLDQINAPLLGLFAGLTSLTGLVAGLAIATTLVASVIERQREIGSLRALGMTRRQVRRLIATEAGLIGVAGAVLGALGGLATALAFNISSEMMMGELSNSSYQLLLPWAVALGALILGPLMSVLVALWPAVRATRINPAEAMRGE